MRSVVQIVKREQPGRIGLDLAEALADRTFPGLIKAVMIHHEPIDRSYSGCRDDVQEELGIDLLGAAEPGAVEIATHPSFHLWLRAASSPQTPRAEEQ